jgi:hypothetical protein
MFSIQHSSILSCLEELQCGLQPVFVKSEGVFSLLVKTTKEMILTARLNQQFKVYFVPQQNVSNVSIGVITAFFDDLDEPLVLFTPLYADDALLVDLSAVLGQESFDLYFFDEHDREWLGVNAHVENVEHLQEAFRSTHFPDFRESAISSTLIAMNDWFRQRVTEDDEKAFLVQFNTTLYPDDLMLFDLRPSAHDFYGSKNNPAMTTLERDEPGAFQERDMVRLLRRSFPGESIFLNPIRTDTGRELSDILCLTEYILLLVQAKDSPNNEAILRRSLDRKRAIIQSHIEKGSRQLHGALSYVRGREEVEFNTTSGVHRLVISERLFFGLIIVREIFDNDRLASSAPVLDVARKLNTPCVLLDYFEMHAMTLNLGSPIRLLNGLSRLFEAALKYNEYPKQRFLGQASTTD